MKEDEKEDSDSKSHMFKSLRHGVILSTSLAYLIRFALLIVDLSFIVFKIPPMFSRVQVAGFGLWARCCSNCWSVAPLDISFLSVVT